MHLEDEYPGELREMIRVIKHDPDKARSKWPSSDRMADYMRPDSAHNHDIFDLLESPPGMYLRITPAQLMSALKTKKKRLEKEAREQQKEQAREQKEQERETRERQKEQEREAREQQKEQERETRERQKEQEREAKEQEREAKQTEKEQSRDKHRLETMAALEEVLGGIPTTEREFVNLKLAKDGVTMTFDRQFHTATGERRKAEQISLDLHLTAADLALVKPRGDLLAATNIERSFTEWCIGQRLVCIDKVRERITTAPVGVDPDEVIEAFEQVCGYYFKEPLFAARAIQKMIWQVKRMMHNMPIEQRHMCVFLGEQNCGKTYVQRMLSSVIRELVAEASLKDVLDERQMDLPEYLIILLDELVAADRADSAALKNFITGQDWSRRPMRTNVVEKVKLRASLFGTSNHSLGKLIFDSTGMRRFVELAVLPRPEIEPNWQKIINFNWLQLWQTVDVTAEDPLMAEFADLLMNKQEDLRNADNVETWLCQYEPDRHNAKFACKEYNEWHAQELYSQFRVFEEQYDRGWRGTSLTRWGRDMKSLIDNGHAPNWSHYKYGAKTIYRLTLVEEQKPADTIRDIRERFARARHN